MFHAHIERSTNRVLLTWQCICFPVLRVQLQRILCTYNVQTDNHRILLLYEGIDTDIIVHSESYCPRGIMNGLFIV